jgi:hypothetical protein
MTSLEASSPEDMTWVAWAASLLAQQLGRLVTRQHVLLLLPKLLPLLLLLLLGLAMVMVVLLTAMHLGA